MMRSALALEMCAILRIKKSKMKYRALIKGSKKEFLNAQELYTRLVKREWKKGARPALEGRIAGC
jgi:hypothetical protein